MSEVLHLPPGQTALFGYGSLFSIRSLEATLGRRYEGPYLTCSVRGWRRTWDAAMTNKTFYTERAAGRMYPEAILYLNVRREPDRLLNGVLFVAGPAELAKFDQRESIYDRVDITGEIEGVRIEWGAAYLYTARPEHTLGGVSSSEVAAVRASYVKILEDGFADHGAAFRTAYDASSDPMPASLLIDDRR